MNEGTGLGLSMAYGTIQSHGGTITATSAPGQGTNFELFLPLLKDATLPAAVKHETASADGSGTTILLADDNRALLEVVTSVLEQLNYRVIMATDGLQAVEIYKADHADIALVILDVVMPGMSGIEASKQIRGINPFARIIFLTGYDPSQHFNMKDMTSEKVVTKPFEVATFSQLVKSTLEQ